MAGTKTWGVIAIIYTYTFIKRLLRKRYSFFYFVLIIGF